jgi:hypothetical protein
MAHLSTGSEHYVLNRDIYSSVRFVHDNHTTRSNAKLYTNGITC